MSRPTSRKWDRVRGHIARYGVLPTAVYAVSVAAWRLRVGRAGYLMRLDPSSRWPDVGTTGISFRLLPGAEALAWADPRNDRFSPAVLSTCVDRGDSCVAAFAGKVLVGAAWFSTGVVRQLGAWWRPAPPAVLEHLLWVDAAMRGRRLAAGINVCFRRANPGVPVLGVVEIGNYAERRSMRRLGYRFVGALAQIGPERWNVGFAAQGAHLKRCPPPGATT
jgi:hypothetical protein